MALLRQTLKSNGWANGSPKSTRGKDPRSPHNGKGSPKQNSPASTPPQTLNRGQRIGDKRYGPEDATEFRLEDGSETSPLVDRQALMGNIMLENPEIETRWYFKYFLGQSHKNYICSLTTADGDIEPVLLSCLIEETEETSVRAILWRKTGSERLLIRIPKGKPVNPKKIVTNFGHGPPDAKLLEIKDFSIQDLLLVLEEQEGAVHFKFGVLYAKSGQTTDNEMFSNQDGSPKFINFYKALGKVSPQKGFSGWRAGLDVNNGTTGTNLVHATEFGKEIVFHVSTMLPWSSTNPQQVERKRHLGNNVCNMVFMEEKSDEDETPFFVDKFASQFTHIFAVVTPLSGERYRLKVYTKNTVPEYGPPLPNPAIFQNLDELRHFLIVKLLNGEKATLSSPISSFANKKERTLDALITDIHDKFDRKRTLTRKKSITSPKVYGRERVEQFRNKGQSIKMTKIAMGVAPTSARSTSKGKEPGMEPWTPICITSNLKQQVVAGDAWGSDFVGSSAFGVTRFFVDKHMSGELESTVLIDNSISMVQLNVDEDIEMLFCRSSANIDDAWDSRNGQLYAIPLDVFVHRDSPLNKKDIKKYMIGNTRGATAYSTHAKNTSTASILQNACKLAVAVGKKLRTFRFVPTNPARVPGMGSGGTFQLLYEFPTQDNIHALALGAPTPGNTGQYVSVALNSGSFALIDIESGSETALPVDMLSAVQVQPVMCLQVVDPIDEMQQEFIICFNQSVEFKHTNGHNSRQYDVRFSSRPQAIAYVYPYLLGFTNNSIEVVTMINGSLVKTLPMQRCRFLGSKKGVYFTSTLDGTTMLYKMSEDTLSGKATVDGSMGQLQQQVAPGNVFVRRMSVNKMSKSVSEARDRVADRKSNGSRKPLSISEEDVASNQKRNPLYDDFGRQQFSETEEEEEEEY